VFNSGNPTAIVTGLDEILSELAELSFTAEHEGAVLCVLGGLVTQVL